MPVPTKRPPLPVMGADALVQITGAFFHFARGGGYICKTSRFDEMNG